MGGLAILRWSVVKGWVVHWAVGQCCCSWSSGCREAEIGGRLFGLRKSDHAAQRRRFRFRLGKTIQGKVLGLRELAGGARGKLPGLRKKLPC